jgi:hypothetical protein
LSAFTTSVEIDLNELYESYRNLLPLGSGVSYSFINLDGIVLSSTNTNDKSYAYLQFFRNYCLESVRVFEAKRDGEKYLPSTSCEQILIKAVIDYRKFLLGIGFEMPLTVFVTLLGVKEYEFVISDEFWVDKRRSDRNNLIFSEVIISRQEDDLITILRPIFDKLWNAFGISRSLNFNENGEWKSR